MPHCGIQARDSTSWNPATPSWNCGRIVSEITNVSSDAKRAVVLIAVTALRGTNARISAAAIGNQMVQLRMLVMGSQFAVRSSQLPSANCSAAYCDLRTLSCKYPYENN